MKVKSIDSHNTQCSYLRKQNLKTNFVVGSNYINQPHTISTTYYTPKIRSIFESYDAAKNIFKENIKNEKGIFGDNSNIEELMSNDRIRRNVVKFLSEYSKEEIDRIDKKKTLSIDELEYRKGLTEVNQFFSEFLELWPENELHKENYYEIKPKMLAFAGNLSEKDEKHCKNVVHFYSAVCSAISATMGEGAAIGRDTPFLRAAQFMMFAELANYMKVPSLPSIEYYTKEMFVGSTLGVRGAEVAIALLGLGGHAASVATGTTLATGGSSDKAITAGVRGVNGVLSGLITEKMGRGYIKRVKQNRMTFKDQSFELINYFSSMALLDYSDARTGQIGKSIAEAKDPDLIKKAIMKMPKNTLKTTSALMELLKDTTDTGKALFLQNCCIKLLLYKKIDKETSKKIIKESLEEAVLQSIFYSLGNEIIYESIKNTSQGSIKNLKEALSECPEVFRTFINKEHDFFEKLDIDIIDSKSFVNQFKDKKFSRNLSVFIKDSARDIINGYTEAQNKKLAGMEYLDNISGYKNTKKIILDNFVNKIPPSSILLYGVSSNSNKEIAKIILNLTNSSYVEIDNPDRIEELRQILKSHKNESENNRKSILIYVENYDEFYDNNEVNNTFKQFMNECKKDNVIVVYSTSYPNEIDNNLKSCLFKIPVDMPDRNDYFEILNKYFKELLSAEEIEKIVEMLTSKQDIYTTEQVELLCKIALSNQDENIINEMIKLVSNTRPSIQNVEKIKFEKHKQNEGGGYEN